VAVETVRNAVVIAVAVITVRNTVMVAVMAAAAVVVIIVAARLAVAVAWTLHKVLAVVIHYPAAFAPSPAVVDTDPLGRRVAVARAFLQPVAGNPHVAVAVPAPYAWRPDIAVTRRRHAFKTQRWRSVADHDAEVNLCLGGGRRDSSHAKCQGGCSDKFRF